MSGKKPNSTTGTTANSHQKNGLTSHDQSQAVRSTPLIMESVDESETDEKENESHSIPDHENRTRNRASSVWDHMTKTGNDKATCNICDAVLSRKNSGTTGLRKHLNSIHQIKSISIYPTKKRRKPHQLPVEKKKILDSLIVKCIIEDGRSFGDLRRSGVLKVFNHLIPGKK